MARYRCSIALLILLSAASAQAQSLATFPAESSAEPVLTAAAGVPSEPVSTTAAVAPQQQPVGTPVSADSNSPPRRATLKFRPIRGRETTEWYGWQTLITDGAALMSIVASAASSSDSGAALAMLGVGSYALGGPIVHAAHGNWGRSAASFGLRSGLPLLGAGLGYAAENCGGGGGNSEWCGIGGMLVGGALGIVAAVVLDSAVLARETVQEEPRYAPYVEVGKGGASVGMAGRF